MITTFVQDLIEGGGGERVIFRSFEEKLTPGAFN